MRVCKLLAAFRERLSLAVSPLPATVATEPKPRKLLQLYRPEDVEREAMIQALIISGFRLRMVLARERAKWRYAELAVTALLNRTRVQSGLKARQHD